MVITGVGEGEKGTECFTDTVLNLKDERVLEICFTTMYIYLILLKYKQK